MSVVVHTSMFHLCHYGITFVISTIYRLVLILLVAPYCEAIGRSQPPDLSR
jgi:hypothetical protein